MDSEYAAVWRELDPKSFSDDLIPEFYRVFKDYLKQFKDTWIQEIALPTDRSMVRRELYRLKAWITKVPT